MKQLLLKADDLHFSYGAAPVLKGISLSLAAGEMVALLGPNGSAKSTLIQTLLGLHAVQGSVEWFGRSQWGERELARKVAHLPQSPTRSAEQTVEQVLSMGRAPFWGAFGLETDRDSTIVRRVAGETGLSELLDRKMEELSGGQRQRVFVGRCLVQEPLAMLLDEPGTFLDLAHQVELYRMLRKLAQQGLGIMFASHDLNLASAFADRVILLSDGTIAAEGSESQVLTAEVLGKVYGVAMERIERAGRAAVVTPVIDRGD